MNSAVFGPYRLDAVLARGPAATVYRARDTSHSDRVVVVKVFAPPLSSDAAFRDRFRRDAGLLSALREPHVAPIHRYGEIDGACYLDMRLVRGPSLADSLRAGALDPARATAIRAQIAVAVEALRRSGLGERPIEPGDVLLTGTPGHEFVQLVGLDLGRPPARSRTPGWLDALVHTPDGVRPPPASAPRPRRRRRLAVVTTALLMAAAALATVIAVGRGYLDPAEVPVAEGRPALVATITDVAGGVVDADIAELDGQRVLVAATAGGDVRTWSLLTGDAVRPPIPSDAVAVGTATLDGRTVVVSRRRDTTVVAHDLVTGTQVGVVIGTPSPVPVAGPAEIAELVRAGLVTTELGGTPVVVTPQVTGLAAAATGSSSPQVGLGSFAIPDGAPVGPVVSGDWLSVDKYTVTEVDHRPTIVSVDEIGRVRALDLSTGAEVGSPSPPQPAAIYALTTTVRDGAPVALTGSADNAARIWDLRTGEQVVPPLTGHTRGVAGLATVRRGNRTVVVSASAAYPADRGEIRFSDLATGEPLGSPVVGHPLTWRLAAASDGEPSLLVAAPLGEPVTVWDVQRMIEGE